MTTLAETATLAAEARAGEFFLRHRLSQSHRTGDAVACVVARRLADGRWPLQQRHPGATFFEMETVGRPSRWNTLRAIRVLRWWNGDERGHA